MAGETQRTTDHDTIKRWVEERDGYPATVEQSGEGGEPGVLRIDFPGYSGEEALERITWDEFFDKFEAENLAFLYQEELSDGEESRFFKFVSRD